MVTRESAGWHREYSTPYAAKAISEVVSDETTIPRVYLYGLRERLESNPTVSVIRAIAKSFDGHRAPSTPPITAAYLLGDDASQRHGTAV